MIKSINVIKFESCLVVSYTNCKSMLVYIQDTFIQNLLHCIWCQLSVHYFGLLDWSKSL